MPVKQITNSSKILALGFKAHFNLLPGKLLVDMSPSVFTAGGQNTVIGASLIVTSPSGIVMSSGAGNIFTPPMNQTPQIDIPLFGEGYEWGLYQFRLTLDEGLGQMQINRWLI
jgi:hypothetical protein